jgi:hypothetical protein
MNGGVANMENRCYKLPQVTFNAEASDASVFAETAKMSVFDFGFVFADRFREK